MPHPPHLLAFSPTGGGGGGGGGAFQEEDQTIKNFFLAVSSVGLFSFFCGQSIYVYIETVLQSFNCFDRCHDKN